MSFLVCHIQKFKSSDVKGMQIHNQRESKNSKNVDIDHEKTKLNFDLHNRSSVNYNKRVKEILENGYKGTRAIRKDAVVMTSTLVTSDSEFFKKLSPEKQKEFFKQSYEYFKERYGEKNIVSATIHLDEKTPHMHLCSVPLTEDGKLSAKTLLDRKSLREIQDELPKHLQAKGFVIERGKEGSENSHVEINEFKKQTAEELGKELDKNIDTIKTHLNELQDVFTSTNDITRIETKKSLTGSKITLKTYDYNKLLESATKGVYLSSENNHLKSENKRLLEENREIKSALNSYEDSIKGLKSQSRKDKKSMEKTKEQYKEQGQAMFNTLKRHNLIPEAQQELEAIKQAKEAEKVVEKALSKSKDFRMER